MTGANERDRSWAGLTLRDTTRRIGAQRGAGGDHERTRKTISVDGNNRPIVELRL